MVRRAVIRGISTLYIYHYIYMCVCVCDARKLISENVINYYTGKIAHVPLSPKTTANNIFPVG